jgi:geranylgeranyl reductase family protein
VDTCDVLIVGGGPAGSSCAWRLRESGLDVRILDRRKFPRNKVCGGWITPAVLQELSITPQEYAAGRVFQPITGFRTSRMGDLEVETRYDTPVSYGIRRWEFDHYLLARSGARVLDGEPLERLERRGDVWICNDRLRARVLIGAGGHFCPVARHLGARLGAEPIVAAQELEVLLDERQARECSVRAEIPELYFCADLKGYGWCFRKDNVLNVGLGRLDARKLGAHVDSFVRWLKRGRKVPADFPDTFQGHAYLLYGWAERRIAGDGVLVVGDAAGLAYPQSGEGIRPAVESGLIAGGLLAASGGRFTPELAREYRRALEKRFGAPERDWAARLASRVPAGLVTAVGRRLLATRWFARRVVIDHWFLHRDQPALAVS